MAAPSTSKCSPAATTNDLSLMIRTAGRRGRITFATEDTCGSYLDRGDWIYILEILATRSGLLLVTSRTYEPDQPSCVLS